MVQWLLQATLNLARRCLDEIGLVFPVGIFGCRVKLCGIFRFRPEVGFGLIARLIEWLIEYFPDIGATFRLPTASLIYAYIVSCWTIHVWDKWLTRKSRKIAVLIGITPVIFLYLPIVLFQPSIFLGHLTKIISGFSFLFLVLITYIVSIYGLYRLMKT